ncbi:hypothetical protein GCM10022237_35660 [Nocardioides ginsengisoli]|uniref:Uncharacterized protein n=1 Tax=Nocardioides ginsengisoli TaxID=363868 RepID=A0ABW3W1D0_9ACTN
MHRTLTSLALVAALTVAGSSLASADDAGTPGNHRPLAARKAPPSPAAKEWSSVSPCLLGTVKVKAGQTRALAVRGRCGVPAWATDAAVNVLAHSTTRKPARTYVGAVPVAASPGRGDGTGQTTLTLSPSGALAVKATGGTAKVSVYVTGFAAPSIHAVLAYNGGIVSGSPRVLSSTRTSAGSYDVVIDRDISNCTPIASINGSAFFASAYRSGPSTVHANTYNPAGTPVDLYWTLTVIC